MLCKIKKDKKDSAIICILWYNEIRKNISKGRKRKKSSKQADKIL